MKDIRFPPRFKAFTLVEVTLALGILAFGLLAIFGLLPVGLRSTQDASDQARATDILNLAVTAVQGQYFLGPSGSPAVANYSFANFLSDQNPQVVASDISSPWSKHTKYFVGQSEWNYSFDVLEDCSIRKSGDSTSSRYKLFLHVYPPADAFAPVRVYLSVAWPGAAIYTPSGSSQGWSKQQGYVETVVYANPASSL